MTSRSAARPPRRRADAERNIASILDAAQACIDEGAELTMVAVARRASVSRVTLYSHFSTLSEVVEATVERAIGELDESLAALGLDEGSAAEALTRLLRSQWRALNGFRRLYVAASRELPAESLRGLHAPLMRRLRRLIKRGQAEGSVRADLPTEWLIATIFGLLHQAAEEVSAGRLSGRRAGDVVTVTLMSALSSRIP